MLNKINGKPAQMEHNIITVRSPDSITLRCDMRVVVSADAAAERLGARIRSCGRRLLNMSGRLPRPRLLPGWRVKP